MLIRSSGRVVLSSTGVRSALPPGTLSNAEEPIEPIHHVRLDRILAKTRVERGAGHSKFSKNRRTHDSRTGCRRIAHIVTHTSIGVTRSTVCAQSDVYPHEFQSSPAVCLLV